MDDVAEFGPGKRLSHVHEEDREEKGEYSQGSRNCPYFLLPTVPPTPYLHLSRCGHPPPSFIRTVILVSGTSLAATRTFLHEMRGMRARKLITPRVEDEAAHHLSTCLLLYLRIQYCGACIK